MVCLTRFANKLEYLHPIVSECKKGAMMQLWMLRDKTQLSLDSKIKSLVDSTIFLSQLVGLETWFIIYHPTQSRDMPFIKAKAIISFLTIFTLTSNGTLNLKCHIWFPNTLPPCVLNAMTSNWSKCIDNWS